MGKTAIAVPEDVLDAVDRAAHERGESRSAFVTRVLRAALRARRDRGITRRLSEVFGEPSAAADKRKVTEDLDAAGDDWSTERW